MYEEILPLRYVGGSDKSESGAWRGKHVFPQQLDGYGER